jgi:hypothetical protein
MDYQTDAKDGEKGEPVSAVEPRFFSNPYSDTFFGKSRLYDGLSGVFGQIQTRWRMAFGRYNRQKRV